MRLKRGFCGHTSLSSFSWSMMSHVGSSTFHVILPKGRIFKQGRWISVEYSWILIGSIGSNHLQCHLCSYNYIETIRPTYHHRVNICRPFRALRSPWCLTCPCPTVPSLWSSTRCFLASSPSFCSRQNICVLHLPNCQVWCLNDKQCAMKGK